MRVRAAIPLELPAVAGLFRLGDGWVRRASARADDPDTQLLLVEDGETCVALLDDARVLWSGLPPVIEHKPVVAPPKVLLFI